MSGDSDQQSCFTSLRRTEFVVLAIVTNEVDTVVRLTRDTKKDSAVAVLYLGRATFDIAHDLKDPPVERIHLFGKVSKIVISFNLGLHNL